MRKGHLQAFMSIYVKQKCDVFFQQRLFVILFLSDIFKQWYKSLIMFLLYKFELHVQCAFQTDEQSLNQR